MIEKFIDFEIQFQRRSDAGFPFSASSAREGEADGTLAVLTDDPAYQALAKRLETLETDADLLARIGQLLFDALFQHKVRDVYNRTLGSLQEGEGLRLKLNVAPTEIEVAALPWEFLYDPDRGPLAMLDTSIVRYPQQAARIPNLAATLPLRVLLTAAQPAGLAGVDAELELQAIRAAIADQGLEQRRSIQIVEEPHLTRSKLQRLLRQGVHIWHFAGHGGFHREAGVLFFEDATGDKDAVSALELGILLRNSGVRLIVLDACESASLATGPFRSMAPALIRNLVPAVVAMQFVIAEESARAFAAEFYNALAAGLPVDACVTEGRKAVMGALGLGQVDWGIPVVYTRAPDGKLFDLPAPAGNSQPPDPGRPDNTADRAAAIEAKREIIRAKRRRLNERQLQQARFGISADPSIRIEIEDLEREIAQLEREIQALGG